MTTHDIPVLLLSLIVAYCIGSLLGDRLRVRREKRVMATRRLWINRLILVAGLIVLGAPRFVIAPQSIFVHAANMVLGALIAIKGISSLPGTASDFVLAYIVVGLVSIEVLTKHSVASGVVLDVITVLVFLVFASTGVTFKALAREHAAEGSS